MSLHPIELRTRVVEAYENKEGSMRALAKRFKVNKSFISDMIKLKRETGSLEPKPHAGGHVPKIDESGLQFIENLIANEPNLKLSEICEKYYIEKKVNINIIDAHRACEKLDITFKKKTSMRQKKTQKESKKSEKNTKRK
jgi:putative transposase